MRDDSADVCLRNAITQLIHACRNISELEEDEERKICHIRLISDIDNLIRSVRRIRNGEGLY